MWGEVLLFGASGLAVVCAGAVVESIIHAENVEIQLRRMTARHAREFTLADMGPQTPNYALLWALWAALFFGIEIPAAINRKPGSTLSETIWRLASIKKQGKLWRWRRLALLTALVWGAVHLFTGGWV